MTTIECKYQNKTKDVYQNDAILYEYSDDPEVLGKIVRELEFITCNLSLADAPWDGKPRVMCDARIGYRGRVLRFDFYHSLADTKEFLTDHKWYPAQGVPRIKARGLDSEFLKNSLYSLLCTIRCEAGIHELSFTRFCDEYGYDTDSRKAYALYERSCDFSRDIAHVFSSEEIGSFPS